MHILQSRYWLAFSISKMPVDIGLLLLWVYLIYLRYYIFLNLESRMSLVDLVLLLVILRNLWCFSSCFSWFLLMVDLDRSSFFFVSLFKRFIITFFHTLFCFTVKIIGPFLVFIPQFFLDFSVFWFDSWARTCGQFSLISLFILFLL